MPEPDAQTGSSAASAWRLRAAHRVADSYRSAGSLVVAFATGSTGRGVGDADSDLDLYFVWEAAPEEARRRASIEALGADLVRHYAYDDRWQLWDDAFSWGREPSDLVHTGLSIEVVHVLRKLADRRHKLFASFEVVQGRSRNN